MNSVETMLKRNHPNYANIIDRMSLVAQEIVNSKDYLDSMNKIVPTLDAMDAYVLGMIIGEFVKDGTLHIEGLNIQR